MESVKELQRAFWNKTGDRSIPVKRYIQKLMKKSEMTGSLMDQYMGGWKLSFRQYKI
jgi:hypothetical protein